MNCNTDCVLGIITQHQCQNSLILFTAEREKIPADRDFSKKPSQSSEGGYSNQFMPIYKKKITYECNARVFMYFIYVSISINI